MGIQSSRSTGRPLVICVIEPDHPDRLRRAANRDVLRHAAAAARPDGRLVVVAVLPPMPRELVFSGGEAARALEEQPRIVARLRQRLEALVEHEAPGLVSDVAVLESRHARPALTEFARESGADMIVVPHDWQSNRLRRLVLGSAIDALALNAGIPVIVAPPPPGERACA